MCDNRIVMNKAQIIEKFFDTYYSMNRVDDEAWQAVLDHLSLDAGSKKKRELVSDLDKAFEDYKVSSEEVSQFRKKYWFSTRLTRGVWGTVFEARQSDWADWASDEFVAMHDEEAHEPHLRPDDSELELIKEVLELDASALSKKSLPLLAEGLLYLADDDLERVCQCIQTLGSEASELLPDLVVASCRYVGNPAIDAALHAVGATNDSIADEQLKLLSDPAEYRTSLGHSLPELFQNEYFSLDKLLVGCLESLADRKNGLSPSKQREVVEGVSSFVSNPFPDVVSPGFRRVLYQDGLDVLFSYADLYPVQVIGTVKNLCKMERVFYTTPALQKFDNWLQGNDLADFIAIPTLLSLSFELSDTHFRIDVVNLVGKLGERAVLAKDTYADALLQDTETDRKVRVALLQALTKIDPALWSKPPFSEHRDVKYSIADLSRRAHKRTYLTDADVELLIDGLSNVDWRVRVDAAEVFFDTRPQKKHFEKALDHIENNTCPQVREYTDEFRDKIHNWVPWKTVDARLASRHVLDKEIAENKGVLGALRDGSELDGVFGTSNLSADLAGGIGGLIAAKGIHVGSGGLGSRGSGLGGGGTAAGLGGLGTKGRGSGKSGYGSGGGNFGPKGEGGVGRIDGDHAINGALDQSLVNAVVKRHINQVRYCYQRELNKNPNIEGQVRVKFVVEGDGSVSTPEIQSSTLKNEAVENCICGRFGRFRFPEPSDGKPVEVISSFRFFPSFSSEEAWQKSQSGDAAPKDAKTNTRPSYGSGGGSFGRIGEGGFSRDDFVILGTLERSEIETVVESQMAKIQAHYKHGLAKNPNLSGKVVVKFVVEADGSVSKASLKSSTLHSREVESAITREFLGFRFPKPDGGRLTIVSYPLHFPEGETHD